MSNYSDELLVKMQNLIGTMRVVLHDPDIVKASMRPPDHHDPVLVAKARSADIDAMCWQMVKLSRKLSFAASRENTMNE